MDDPVFLGLPLTEPEPVPGCERCARLAAQREQYRKAGDETAVSDYNVWLRRHPTHEHKVLNPPRSRSRSDIRRPDQ
jgi:hypothetical protein